MDFIRIGGGTYSRQSWAEYELARREASGEKINYDGIISKLPAVLAACRELSGRLKIIERLTQGDRSVPPLPVTAVQVAGWPQLLDEPDGVSVMRTQLEELSDALGEPFDPEPPQIPSDLDDRIHAQGSSIDNNERQNLLLLESEVLCCAEHMGKLAGILNVSTPVEA